MASERVKKHDPFRDKEIQSFWEAALDDDQGIEVETLSEADAKRIAFQLHMYRKALNEKFKAEPEMLALNRVEEMYSMRVSRSKNIVRIEYRLPKGTKVRTISGNPIKEPKDD